MRPTSGLLAILFLAVPAAARASGSTGDDELAYRKAAQAFHALKADPAKRRARDQWVRAAARFEAMAQRFPRSPRAPQALYSAAELYNDLSHISFAKADRRKTLSVYLELAKTYPDDNLADDALYQAARIELDREEDPDAAREHLDRLLKRYPHGDMVHRAKVLLAQARDAARTNEGKAKVAVRGSTANPNANATTTANSTANTTATANARQGAVIPSEVEGPHAEPATPDDSDDAPEVAETEAPPPTPAANPIAGAPGVPSHVAPSPLEALRRIGSAPGGIPLAVQMGLRVRRVIVDPGHGGHDNGAVGPNGTREKDVTLAIAKRLAEDLRQQGLEVFLTREDDHYVTLEERAAIANRNHADLFISVHCNAARDRRLHGTETYFLNVTGDRYAIRLAARENQSTEKSISDLQLILADLATKADVAESETLADAVQKTLVERGGESRTIAPHDLGVKHALFYVLLGAKMPAVLVESAFLSNPDEERELRTPTRQAEIAQRISQGVMRFLDQRSGFAAVP